MLRGSDGAKRSLTEGPMIRPLLLLSLPIMASNAMQTAYNVADAFWLGRVGAEAVAALSISWPLIFLIISVAGGLSMAGTTLVAQYTGAERAEDADHMASQVFALLLILGGSLGIVGVLSSRALMTFIGAPPEVLPLATLYAQIIFGGIILMFGFYVFQALVSGCGDTVTPMKLMLLSTLMNLVLDPFLIFGIGPFPRMEVAGAAVATVLSRGIASAIGFHYLFSGRKGVRVRLRDMKPEFGTVTKIAKLGVPSAVEQSALGLGFTIMAAVVAGYGTVALAAYGIGTRLISVLSMPAMGFSMALGIMVGQNLGAGKEKRANRITWLSSGTTLLVLAVGSAVCFLLAKPLVSAFMTQQEYEVIELGTEFLKLIALGLSPFGVRVVIGGAFRGAGDTFASMILSILALWGLRIPLAIGLGAEMGVSGVWYSIFLSNLAGGLIAAVWFRRGKWVEKSISGRGWAPRPQSRIPPSPETEK